MVLGEKCNSSVGVSGISSEKEGSREESRGYLFVRRVLLALDCLQPAGGS